MPYYHKGCGGEVAFWSLRCKKCGHRWGLGVMFSVRPLLDRREGPAKDISC